MNSRVSRPVVRRKRYEDPIAPFVMPSDLQAEIAVIGCLMMYKDLVDKTIELVTREMIYTVYYQGIWDAIMALVAKHSPIDINTIISECVTAGHLPENPDTEQTSVLRARLVDAQVLVIGNKASHETYCESLRFAHERRKAILTAQDLIQATLNAWVPDDMDTAKAQAVGDLAGRSTDSSTVGDMHDILEEVYDAAAERAEGENPKHGVPTAFRELNEILGGGFQCADLILLAGRPGMCKTSLATEFGISACADGYHVVFFSMEMSKRQIGARVLSQMAMVPSRAIRNARKGDNYWDALVKARQECKDMRMLWTVDERSDHTPASMAATCRQVARERGKIGLIIVDHVGFVRSSKQMDNRNAELGEIARSLKGIAKEQDAPMIVLSQLSRKVEDRGNKVPQLSDLYESGHLEAAADLVIFPYRPGYYDSPEKAKENAYKQQEVQLIIAKHRDGELGAPKVAFIAGYTRFEELNEMGALGDTDAPPNRQYWHDRDESDDPI